MRNLTRLAILATAALLSWNTSAQSGYVKPGSIGIPAPKVCPTNPVEFRSLDCWIGERFVFLPKRTQLQRYGYDEFAPVGKKRKPPAYASMVGRVGSVVSVERDAALGFGRWIVTLEMEDNHERYSAGANEFNGQVRGIGPARDIDFARAKWIGRTVWSSHEAGSLLTYNDQTDLLGSVPLPFLSKLTVADVTAGWEEYEPIRVIFKTEAGEVGFLQMGLSGTNSSGSSRSLASRFDVDFFEQDPRTVNDWPENVWTAIAGGKVFVGMTGDQARMSVGAPESINSTVTAEGKREQWVYRKGAYLYVTGGVVTAIQN